MDDSSGPIGKKRVLNAALWLAQALVAVSFISGGIMKLAIPIPKLADMWAWTGDLPATAVMLLGVIDIAGGIGVLLPALTRVMPRLTSLAALGCVALQVCAGLFHASRGEMAEVPVNLVFMAICAFIAWGRWKEVPIRPRNLQ